MKKAFMVAEISWTAPEKPYFEKNELKNKQKFKSQQNFEYSAIKSEYLLKTPL